MILQTVAIPCYNSQKIAWLSMEGLCNQQNIDYSWELIVCEEKHNAALGEEFFTDYRKRLNNVGCEKITYLHPQERTPLPLKWKMMGEAADENSKSFLLQDVDDCSASLRLSLVHQFVGMGEYDWLRFNEGIFFSFLYNKTLHYISENGLGLSMSMKTQHAKQIPYSTIKRGVNGFLYENIRKTVVGFKRKKIVDLHLDALYTDGFNNVSNRNGFYRDPHNAFHNTDITLDKLTLSEDIKEKLNQLIIKK